MPVYAGGTLWTNLTLSVRVGHAGWSRLDVALLPQVGGGVLWSNRDSSAGADPLWLWVVPSWLVVVPPVVVVVLALVVQQVGCTPAEQSLSAPCPSHA